MNYKTVQRNSIQFHSKTYLLRVNKNIIRQLFVHMVLKKRRKKKKEEEENHKMRTDFK